MNSAPEVFYINPGKRVNRHGSKRNAGEHTLRKLRSKLLVITLIITALPLLIFGVVLFESQRSEMESQLEGSLFSLSNNLSLTMESVLSERMNDLDMMTMNPVLQDENAAPSDIRNELEQMVEAENLYMGIVYIDTNGDIVTSTRDEVIGKNVSDRVWYQKAREGNPTLEEAFIDPILKQPIIPLAAPVENDAGRVTAVISPSINENALWEVLWQRLNKMGEHERFSGQAFVVNNEGEYIAYPNSGYVLEESFLEEQGMEENSIEELIAGQEEQLIEHGNDVSVITPVENVGSLANEWYVGYTVPKSGFYANLRQLVYSYLFVFSVVLIITVFAVFKLSKYIVHPVERLAEATSRFAIGKKVFPLQTNAYEEVDVLTNTFNHMSEQLEERERGHRQSTMILETTDNGVIAVSRDLMNITTFNATCEKLFGLDRKDALGHSVQQVMEKSEDFRNFVREIEEHRLNDMQLEMKEIEVPINEKNRTFLVNMTILPPVDAQKSSEGIVLIFNDITEKKDMENELVRSEKLKMVGQLSAGFAHEIRNPLTTIKGFVQLFRQSAKKEKDIQHYDLVLNEIDRMNSIVEDLLGLARPTGSGDEHGIQVNSLLEELLELYSQQAVKNKTFIYTNFGDLPEIIGDRKKLSQVFVNLIKNGLEAMPEGGVLRVETSMHWTGEPYFEVKIKDTGSGMSEEQLQKIGNPFYTTKSNGTGLGLMTVFQIVEDFKGTLEVDSTPGSGTEFNVRLPAQLAGETISSDSQNAN